ncbi:MAG TPA: thioredoxin family protein [Candidatus Limnocylindrales bacterium]|nr:thioredoxin family protein [Candidatus Limnocylindrales bacterium]
MVKTASDMLPLGTPAPDFRLPDAVTGRDVALSDFPAVRPLLVMFICNHCPYVVHVRGEFSRLARDYDGRISIVAINANSIETHPQDGPEHMRALAVELGWRFPFLFDSTQQVARQYHAACTPDFFLFGPAAADGHRPLVYRGQLDSSRPGNSEPVSGRDLRAAMDALLAGRQVAADQRPSLGCNIKWTPGNEPDYFGASA